MSAGCRYPQDLSIAFDGSKYNSEITPFYIKKWFKYIDKYIVKQTDSSAFSMAVKKYRESVLNNNLNQEKLYVLEGKQNCFKCGKETRVIGFGLENFYEFEGNPYDEMWK